MKHFIGRTGTTDKPMWASSLLPFLSLLTPSRLILLDQSGRPIKPKEWEVRDLEGADFSFGTHQDFLSLPRHLLRHLSADQTFHFLRPGIVEYSELLRLPPAINYVRDQDIDAHLRESIGQATAQYGVPVEPLGYRSRRVRGALDSWAILSVYPVKGTMALKMLSSEDDEFLLKGTDFQMHTPLYNAHEIACNAQRRQPLPEGLSRFVKAATSTRHQANVISYSWPAQRSYYASNGQADHTDSAKEASDSWWGQALEWLLEMVRSIIDLLIQWIGAPSESVMRVRQSLISFPRKKLILRQRRWPQTLCMSVQCVHPKTLMVRPTEDLLSRHVSLVNNCQRRVWEEARRRSLLYHMLLVSMAQTGENNEHYSFGEEDHELEEEITQKCRVHVHADGSPRRGSQYDQPQDTVTGKCTCHFHQGPEQGL